MGKKYKISEYDPSKKYNDDDEFILDDRSFKYDEKTGKIVRPGQPGYDELPDLVR